MHGSPWAAAAVSFVALFGASVFPDVVDAQASFDCRRASHPSEVAVCRDPGLATVDRELDAVYRAALKRSADPGSLRAGQRVWLTDLRNCNDDPFCLYETYADRISVLEAGRAEGGFSPGVANAQTEDLSSGPISDVSPGVAEESGAEPELAPAEQEIGPSAESRSDSQSAAPAHIEREGQRSPTEQTKRGGVLDGLAVGALFILPILAIIGSLLVVRSLANHTMNRYSWPLILNWWNVLYLIGIFGGLFVSTMGVPIAGLGFFGAVWLILLVVNVSKTSLTTGLAMTLIQPFTVFVIYMAMCLGRLWNQQYRRS